MNITMSAEGGAILEGTTRDDAAAIKAVGGWKWSRHLGAWYLPRSWRDETVERKVAATVEALGCTVDVEAVESGADRMARLSDNAEARAERLTDKSDRLAEQARAHHEKARQIADMIPIGQPVLTDHYSARRHRGDIGRIRDGYSKAFAASSEADRLADAARSAEITCQRLTDPVRRMARLVAIGEELAGPMVSDRRRERLVAEREALDVELGPVVFASAETVKQGDIIRWRGEQAMVLRVNRKTVSVGSWTYGTGTGVSFGPVDRPLVLLDPETGKTWKHTDQISWHLIESVVRDGEIVFTRDGT